MTTMEEPEPDRMARLEQRVADLDRLVLDLSHRVSTLQGNVNIVARPPDRHGGS